MGAIMQKPMATIMDEHGLKSLREGVLSNEEKIVALNGVLRALLRRTDMENEEITNAVIEAAKDPVGRVLPEKAVSHVNQLISSTEDQRAINRGG